MSDHCHHTAPKANTSPAFRQALWIALLGNGLMFLVEIVGAEIADSVALLADAADFLGDTANYGLSLAVLSLAVVWRSRTALLKGVVMVAFGLFVLGQAGWNAWEGASPAPLTMGSIALLALAVNVGVAVLLFRFREGDANMRSVWLCSRNDAIGNLLVMLAAVGVALGGGRWPDLAVAALMAWLAIGAGISVIRHARQELGHR